MRRASIRSALGAVVLLGGLVATGPQPAQAAAASPCHADDLEISKAGREAAAGNRYLEIKIRNVSEEGCRLTGFPTFTWRRRGHDIGWPSVPEPGQAAHTVMVRSGRAAFTTLRWVDPAPVAAVQCRARRATGLHMTLAYRPHVYRLPLRAKVCTTQQYRPMAFPVRSTADVG